MSIMGIIRATPLQSAVSLDKAPTKSQPTECYNWVVAVKGIVVDKENGVHGVGLLDQALRWLRSIL